MLSKVLEIEWVNLPTARKNSIAKSQFLAITTSVRYSIPNGRKQWKDVGKDLLQYDYQKSMTPQQANVARNVLLRIVNAMDEDDCGDLTWGIKADKVDPFNGSVDDNCGFTTLKNGTIYVFLDSRLISPLLRDDLTDCERMAGDYYLANTVLHEFGVSCILVQLMKKYCAKTRSACIMDGSCEYPQVPEHSQIGDTDPPWM